MIHEPGPDSPTPYPPAMSVQPAPGSYAPTGPRPHWPILRKKQVFVVPIIAIAIGAIVMTILILMAVLPTPPIGILAVLISALASALGIFLLIWLDRWEPEPPHLLVSAFFWGAGVSVLFVFLISPVLAIVGGTGDFFGAVISAPLVEESAKGLFLVLVLLVTRRGRAEFNTLTDALVYAGFVGIGFSFVEDMLYISGQESVSGALTVAGLRIGLGAWAHSIYTAMTAIGLWLAVSQRGPSRFVWPFVGWAVAVMLHAIHNGSAFLGLGAWALSLLLFSLPAFVVFVVIAVRSHRREGRVMQGQIPIMVHNGWITPDEASWLGNLRSRRQALAHARGQGAVERKRVAGFRDNVTELAFVRDRLDRMGPPWSPELMQQHDELVGIINANKEWVQQQLAPVPQGWQAMPPQPGLDYRAPESMR